MKKLPLLLCLSLSLLPAAAFAKVIQIPKGKPVMSVDVPKSWKPEDTDNGIAIESPDQVATVFFEVTSGKKVAALIDENVDWLAKEQKVKIDGASKKEEDFEADGHKWSRISWDGDSKEWGPSDIGFLFTEAPNGKVLTITYWITKKDKEKDAKALSDILDSVKILGGKE